ncbi:MAG: EAL domain-containing protein [Hyphomicrobiaceae bacterium]|nr:EAL domain-containing protein [Hyphomicrobiaceae bacterium]
MTVDETMTASRPGAGDQRRAATVRWVMRVSRVWPALRGLAQSLLGLLAVILAAATHLSPAAALEAIAIPPEADMLEITARGELYSNRGDALQVETAPGLDGVAGRISVRATTAGTNPNWLVFALTNSSDKDMERWLTADRYTIVGSGAVWPDLDARRIEAVTPSVGFVPERVRSDRADVFRITLEPGQTITFVAELSSERFARVFLWQPIAYELKVRERLLLNGTLLGLTGLLAVFLTVIFAANHKAIFPAAALVAWCVLVYLCVDFGLFHRLFNLRPEDNAVYRAASEAAIAATLVMFLHTFLRLGLAHGLFRMLLGVWILAQLALVAIAVVDPRLAATFARLSFPLIGAVGALVILYLALRNQDRALSIIPSWLLLLVWVFAAAVTLTGRMSGDIVVAGLNSGLVLIVMLIGFTVTQFAFGSFDSAYGASPSEQSLRALAVDGAGAATWEWNARRDEIKVSPIVEAQLGLNGGELSAKVDDFITHVHPADRERFRLMLWSVQDRAGGRIRSEFRLRHTDNSFKWYELEASSVDTSDRRNVRCVGLLRDITDTKRAHERLLHDAVHCSLTGMPNRALFLDRLSVAIQRARMDGGQRPTIIFIDLDKFKGINTSFGLVVGDSLLLTVARRLQRHLGPHDTLSRINGDQFAILLVAEQDPRELASLAERIRRSLRSPIKIAGQEIVLTGSLGIAIYDGEQEDDQDLLKEAEIAMYRAKRSGADRIEIFRPEIRQERDDRTVIASELRSAIAKAELSVAYQPIVYLPTEELVGFEALLRWTHPKLGEVAPSTFIAIAEDSDLINQLGSFVLQRAAEDLVVWQKALPRGEQPLFVSVNVSSRQLFKQDLVPEVRHVIGRLGLPRGSLRLEVTETLMMENPERAVEVLELLRTAGADLAIDDFGTGYSSLAYLQRFPVDAIKLDKSFMQSMSEGDGAGATIVRSLVALSHELGRKVVAEGVEYPEDVSFLRSIECEYGQGFYYGDPMPHGEATQLVEIIAKSESKLEGRGMFKTKPKSALRPKRRKERKRPRPEGDAPPAPMPNGAADAVAAAANGAGGGGKGRGGAAPVSNGAAPPPRPSADGNAPQHLDLERMRQSLPHSTVRPMPRPPLAATPPVGAQPRPGLEATQPPARGLASPPPPPQPSRAAPADPVRPAAPAALGAAGMAASLGPQPTPAPVMGGATNAGMANATTVNPMGPSTSMPNEGGGPLPGMRPVAPAAPGGPPGPGGGARPVTSAPVSRTVGGPAPGTPGGAPFAPVPLGMDAASARLASLLDRLSKPGEEAAAPPAVTSSAPPAINSAAPPAMNAAPPMPPPPPIGTSRQTDGPGSLAAGQPMPPLPPSAPVGPPAAQPPPPPAASRSAAPAAVPLSQRLRESDRHAARTGAYPAGGEHSNTGQRAQGHPAQGHPAPERSAPDRSAGPGRPLRLPERPASAVEPDYSSLPPGIAASLAKLAGKSTPRRPGPAATARRPDGAPAEAGPAVKPVAGVGPRREPGSR